jgi:hypothetical protein
LGRGIEDYISIFISKKYDITYVQNINLW